MKAVTKKKRKISYSISGTGLKWQEADDAIGIEKIAYDTSKKILFIKFRKNEKVYLYFEVEEEMYARLMDQQHKTTFLNKEIKGNYEYEAFPSTIFFSRRII